MVDDSSTPKLLNTELLIGLASVIIDSYLNNALLNQEHSISYLIFLAKCPAFLVGLPLHCIDKLLFSLQGQVLEIWNLIHLDHQPDSQFILILENLLSEQGRK